MAVFIAVRFPDLRHAVVRPSALSVHLPIPCPKTPKRWTRRNGSPSRARCSARSWRSSTSRSPTPRCNDISGGISATADEGSWISTSYLIGEIITIPLTAWFIADLHDPLLPAGQHRALPDCSRRLCGISTNLGEMIIFRAGQGFTGGVFIPTALTVIITYMPKNLQRRRAGHVRVDRHAGPGRRPVHRRLADRPRRLGVEFLHQLHSRHPHVRHGRTPRSRRRRCNLEPAARTATGWGIGSHGHRARARWSRCWRRASARIGSAATSSAPARILAGDLRAGVLLIANSSAKHPVVNLRLLASRNLGLSTRGGVRAGHGALRQRCI